LYYMLGTCVSPLLQVEKIDWDNPPSWAAAWDKNPLVLRPEEDILEVAPVSYDFASLGKALA